MPSPRAVIIVPITILTANFILLPWPIGPRKYFALPIASRYVDTESKAALEPPHRNISWPVSAGT